MTTGGQPRYTRSMELSHLLARLDVQLRELAAFRDLRQASLGPARFRAADGVEGNLAIGAEWPSRAWPVRLEFDVDLAATLADSALELGANKDGRRPRAALRLDVGGEGLLSVDGRILGGLDPYHREYLLPEGLGRSFCVEIRAVPKAPFAIRVLHPRLEEALVVLLDDDVRALHEDLASVVDAATGLADHRPDVAALLADAAAESLASIDLPRHDANAYLGRLARDRASRELIETVWEEWSLDDRPITLTDAHRASIIGARGALTERIARIRERYPPEGELWLSGHAHLDLAWLWPLAETRRKAQRTFRTVLGLLDRYPEWTFNQSMAQLYAYLERDDPDALAQVRERVAEGRWEVVGGMWVEPDGNLLSGESWARQLLMGQRYLEEHVGTRATVAWLPDTFGYAANMPQLLRQAGMRWFFTTKLNWSETNRFPHDLYWWEGLDGSRVLAHSFNNRKRNYNGVIGAEDTMDVWRRFRGKRHARASLFTFGWGDGGGGPTAEMLERAARQRSMPGLPHLVHTRVDAFYQTIETETDTAKLPVWVGEKYLEFHRGTYTSQAEIKRLHRRLEHALVDAEAAAALRWRLFGGTYPAAELADTWRVLLRNQFHDILPGSSVRTVNEEAVAELDGALETATRLKASSLDALASTLLGSAAPSDTTPNGPGEAEDTRLVVWNLTLDDRPLSVELPEGVEAVWFAGRRVPTQLLSGRSWAHAPEIRVPGLGYAFLDTRNDSAAGNRSDRIAAAAESTTAAGAAPTATAAGGPARSVVHATPETIENDLLLVFVLPDGAIAVYDKELDRPAVSEPGNVLWAHPDVPRDFEAWEIDADYAASGAPLAAVGEPEVVSAGPYVGAVRVRRSGSGYDVEQEYRLWASSRRLEIHTRVVAHGRRMLLRATFPTTIRSPRATFETAFGFVERPTHSNTPWDAAQFEVPGLRWADISEPGYGVSLLTDAKYGYAAHGSTLSLSLLRGPVYPDPFTDLGEHRFTYAILPHAHDWRAGTVAAAHDLNAPLCVTTISTSEHAPDPESAPRARDGRRPGRAPSAERKPPPSARLLAVPAGHLRLSALKRSEEGDSLLARLYEPHGARGRVRIDGELGVAIERLSLLEEGATPVHDGQVEYEPFEVITVKLERGA